MYSRRQEIYTELCQEENRSLEFQNELFLLISEFAIKKVANKRIL